MSRLSVRIYHAAAWCRLAMNTVVRLVRKRDPRRWRLPASVTMELARLPHEEQQLLVGGLRLTEENRHDAHTYAFVVGDRGPRGATSAGQGASAGRFPRPLWYCYKHNRGAARFDVLASDRENEDRELPLRCVRPISGRRRNACGWH